MFLHSGLLHIGGNMLYLWIFGNNIEERLGHLGFLIFYLACGVAAAYAHILSDPLSKLPTVGASGAIAGVLGAYFLLFPGAKVDTLLVGLFWVMVRIPAVIVLGMWFLLQIWSAGVVRTVGTEGGVAWWAHIGGFVTGMVLVLVLGAVFGRGRRSARGGRIRYR
jgi:membrane associated rhomboid family serine protease